MLKTKTTTRKFKLENALLVHHFNWANEVIESIENDELLVYDPKDKDAFCNDFDENGAERLLSRAKTPISIKEWLCVGCQCIRYKYEGTDEKTSENAVACYRHNGPKVLWPAYSNWELEGPAAFIGEILILGQIRNECFSGSNENAFKFIIAHELVHVFDILKYVVPAFIDWQSFWKCVLGDGMSCDILQTQLNFKGLFVDSYGKSNELAMIEQYWPSQAKVWFDAFRQTSNGE